jgi:hypothetical protein
MTESDDESRRRRAWNLATLEIATAIGSNTRPPDEYGYIGLGCEHTGTAAQPAGPGRAETDELLRIIVEQAHTIRGLRAELGVRP